MKKVLLLSSTAIMMVNFAFASSNLKMKDVNNIMKENKNKVILIDKKDLNGFISKKTNEIAVKKQKAKVAKIAKEKKRVASLPTVLVKSYSSYIKHLNYTKKKYNLSLYDLLRVTEYLYTHKLNEKHYSTVKTLMKKEVKKYPQIDTITFLHDLNYMNVDVAQEMKKQIFQKR